MKSLRIDKHFHFSSIYSHIFVINREPITFRFRRQKKKTEAKYLDKPLITLVRELNDFLVHRSTRLRNGEAINSFFWC